MRFPFSASLSVTLYGSKTSMPTPRAHWQIFLCPGKGSMSPNCAASHFIAPLFFADDMSLLTHLSTSGCALNHALLSL